LRTDRASGLVSLRVNICGLGSSRWRTSICATRAKKLKSRLDMGIIGIKLGCSLIGIQRIGDLVVAAFIL